MESPLAPKRPSNVFELGYQPKRLRPEQSTLLLTECVNLSQDPEAMVRFKREIARKLEVGFEELFPEVDLHEEASGALDALPVDAAPKQAIYKNFFDLIRNWLRRIWEDPNPRRKELHILALRDYVNGLRKPLHQRVYRLILVAYWGEPGDPQEPTPFEQALLYLLKSYAKLRCCPHLECPARYFFALRRNQRYCSVKCAQIAEREQKRDWWNAHGKERRSRDTKKGKRASYRDASPRM